MSTSTQNNKEVSKTAHFSASIVSDPKNANAVDYYDRSASVFEGNTSMASDGSYLGTSFDDLSDPHYKGKRKMTNPNVKFVEKSTWKNNTECNVCERKLDKLKGLSTHHCRLCASAVCGFCSNRRVNGERVCDICFFKQKTEIHEKRREEFIMIRNERIKQAEHLLQQKKEEFIEVKEKVSKAQTQVENTTETHDSGLGKLESNQEEESSHLKKIKDTNDQLRRDIAKMKTAERDREETLKNIKTKISVLKLQMSQKKAIIGNKTGELENLKKIKKALEARNPNQIQNEPVAETQPSSTSVSRNYSLKEKDGKYDISFQPVNI